MALWFPHQYFILAFLCQFRLGHKVIRLPPKLVQSLLEQPRAVGDLQFRPLKGMIPSPHQVPRQGFSTAPWLNNGGFSGYLLLGSAVATVQGAYNLRRAFANCLLARTNVSLKVSLAKTIDSRSVSAISRR